MRFALINEAWHPQVNGVVTTWSHVTDLLSKAGHEVLVIHPGNFRSVPLPNYPSIRVTVKPGRRLKLMLEEYKPHAIHIATEGPLGLATRRYCARRGLPFTTSYHTQFPDYFRKYYGFPASFTYRYMRWFHGGAARTLVPTASLKARLDARGFRNIVTWTRGVDQDMFHPADKSFIDAPRPVFLCAGRVALEKNLPAFLGLDLPGTKIVMGDGPALPRLRRRFPAARFVGYQPPAAFAATMAAADVFVFPSLTDTFGLVMIESLACGVPVAAFPVTGPIDVLRQGQTGVMHDDLRTAAMGALKIDPTICRADAARFTWENCTRMLEENLATRG